ncbi:MAG: hypothetical protein LE178_03085, partial [Endomicrobium sp.]|nr:hypothetical protein [Endomicrobium sp.]
MTLRLRRCVSLFVCLSLLVSACSPDKSSKAGSNVSLPTRTSVVQPRRGDKSLAPHPTHQIARNVPPVSFWDREIGKVGGVSITPTRAVVGTVAILGTVAVVGGGVWWLGHKKGWWKKSSTQQKGVEVTNADDNNVNNRGGGEVSQHGGGEVSQDSFTPLQRP